MERIETKRLILRNFVKEDARAIYEGWATDPEVTKYLTWNPHKNLAETEKILALWLAAYKREGTYRFAIERKEDTRLIGMIDVVGHEEIPEIGYVLARPYWNQGYMSEALAAFMYLLIAEGFEKIYIEADENNQASNAIIRKHGFKFLGKERTIKSDFKKEWVTLNTYQFDK